MLWFTVVQDEAFTALTANPNNTLLIHGSSHLASLSNCTNQHCCQSPHVFLSAVLCFLPLLGYRSDLRCVCVRRLLQLIYKQLTYKG